MRNPVSKVRYFLIALILAGIALSCRKKEDMVPYVYVNFTVYLSDPDFATLQTVGNYVFVTGGVSGIVIYRYSQTEFTALDRCCTYQPSERCAVIPDTSNTLFLICPCCSSKFSMLDGTVQSGPANRALTSYSTVFDGNVTLQVTN